MKTLPAITRLAGIVASLGITAALFQGVASLAEPQRSQLLAQRAAQQERPAKVSVRVADAR